MSKEITMRTVISALAALTLAGVGCKETADDDSTLPSAQKQVEQAQEESAEAYERAKQAQETAAEEAREAARAQDGVDEKRQELMAAEQKAAASQQEAQAAQERARAEGESAHQEAQHSQQRAEVAQATAAEEVQARSQPMRRTPTAVSGTTRYETVTGLDPIGQTVIDAMHATLNNTGARIEQQGVDMTDDRLEQGIDTTGERIEQGVDNAGDTDVDKREGTSLEDNEITRPINPMK